MRSRRRNAAAALAALLFAGCGGPAAPWPEPPAAALDLKIDVAPTRGPLLLPIVVSLDLYRRADLDVEFTPQVAGADFLAEATAGPEVPFGPGLWRRTTLVLRPVRGPGELLLPPFVARAKDGSIAASTPEVKFTVESALVGQGAGIEAPGEPFGPRSLRWWYVLGGFLLGALLLALWLLRSPARRGAQAPEIALPSHVKAQRALARLRGLPRTTAAQVEAFYVEVSNVLRTYLEERFALRAPERTTEEFLRDLESGDRLARDHRGELERFLSQCDLVKFAAVVPGEAEHLAVFALAEAFVDATRPDRAPASPGPEVAA